MWIGVDVGLSLPRIRHDYNSFSTTTLLNNNIICCIGYLIFYLSIKIQDKGTVTCCCPNTAKMSSKTIIAFDLYGTLLSTESIAKELAAHFGAEKANTIAALWRRYQLEYTWRMNSMCSFSPFLLTFPSSNPKLHPSNITQHYTSPSQK
jgi:hypothetical protein